MTHRKDAARDADVLGRWRMLAEQRLEYLTHLFESGRWRRYYGELAFLENIREAKVAVETWRGLSTGRAMPERPVMRVTWPTPEPPSRARAIEPAPMIAAEPIELPVTDEADIVPVVVDMFALEQALDSPEPALDLAAIERRYPRLRNSL
jgi:uncharacterized repeat protein (TIGR03809 family)